MANGGTKRHQEDRKAERKEPNTLPRKGAADQGKKPSAAK